MHPSIRLRLAAVISLLSALPGTAAAQWQQVLGPRGAVLGAPVGSDVERYLRALAFGGLVGPLPWGSRGFDADDVAELARTAARQTHPWRRHWTALDSGRAHLGSSMQVGHNTGFPWGSMDGPQWQGRGLNGAIGVAATIRSGVVRATLAPLGWTAANQPYGLMQTWGRTPFADPLFPTSIDLPQRFGDGRTGQWAPGESSVRLRLGGAAIGVSTGALGWGPMDRFPGLLGANAGGFPHVFAGTRATGVRVPVLGRVTGRYILGVLEQSPWSPVTGSATFSDSVQSGRRRIGVGVTGSLMPSFLPGLELGASRFFHSPFRAGGARWRPWAKPFEEVFKSDFENRDPASVDPTGDIDNQLAAFFARWAFPRRGLELSFEAFRDDHSWDWRDLAQEPEQNGAVAAGLRVLTHRGPERLAVLSLEYFDGDVRRIAQQRPQGFLYQHNVMRQGHTLRGQLLGQPIGAGAIEGQSIAWERFTADGSVRMGLERWRPRSKTSEDPQLLFVQAVVRDSRPHDTILDFSVALTRTGQRLTRGVEAGVAVAPTWQFGAGRTNAYLRLHASAF